MTDEWSPGDDAAFTADTGTGGFTADNPEFAADNFGFGNDNNDNGACEPTGDAEGHHNNEGRSGGGCFNCGEEGHNKAECPNPKVDRPFTGTCRTCNQEGHRSAECPEKPPIICRLCNVEGHRATECTATRTDMWPVDTPNIDAPEAWENMKKADDDKDIDVFKANFFAYCKVVQLTDGIDSINPADLEGGFRADDMNMHLIAVEKKNLVANMTIASLSGVIDQKYVLTFSWSPKPRNKMMSLGWPSSPEENIERLSQSGLVIDRGVPMCTSCGKLGHVRKHCKEEDLVVREKPEITCNRCNEVGHRIRDCPKEPVSKNLCRNCQQPGHKASECTEPRSAASVECKRCNEMGHFARDCPNAEERPARACRNCDSTEHMARECPEPKDWSRVQCSNCEQFGHTKVRCKEPLKDVEGDGHGDGGLESGGAVQAVDGGMSAVGDWGNAGRSNAEGVSLDSYNQW